MKYKKTTLLSIALFLLILSCSQAVTVSCGTYVSPGIYSYQDKDSENVQVTINTYGTIITATPNSFTLMPGQTQLVTYTSTPDSYGTVTVTFTGLTSGFSASLQCPIYAVSNPYITTTPSGSTTTTTVPSSCAGLSYTVCISTPGCRWIGDFRAGYCTSDYSTTTTPSMTTTTVSVTTTPSYSTTTTTTPQSVCSGRSYQTCISTPGCEWIGSPITGYCRSISITTTTLSVTTLSTTTTTVQESSQPPSSGGSGSSGGGSSGSSGGSSSTNTKQTGLYNFPSFIQISVGEQKTIKGYFYTATEQNNVRFQLSDLDSSWYTISPSYVKKMNKTESVEVTISFDIPEDATQDVYIFNLSATADKKYFKSITLSVGPKLETTTTTTTIQQIEEKQPTTGFFVKAIDFAKGYWYVLLIPVLAFGVWKISSFVEIKSKGIASTMSTDNEYDYSQDYMEIKYKEPITETQIQSKPVETIKREEEIRKKVIKEIRERALNIDRKFLRNS